MIDPPRLDRAGTSPRPAGRGDDLHRKGDPSMATEAYCVKCREKREIKDPQEVTMKNGRPALKGTCPVCGTGLFRLLGSKEKEKAK